MTLILITSNPEVNNQGLKRWFIGDDEQGRNKIFLFESDERTRRNTKCKRFMLRTFTAGGKLIRENFFDRYFELNRFLCKLFGVDEVDLGQRYTYAEAHNDKHTLYLYDTNSN